MEETLRRRRLLIILYLGFISLGLPDTVLGVAWPEMRRSFNAPLDWAGALLTLTTVLSVLSSLAVAWLIKKFHAGLILTASALMTAGAMLGYGLAPSMAVVAGFTLLFGLGQGAVDSAVNAHMSRHYSSRQMNWIHGCWGLGATGGPLIFTAVFGLGFGWRTGYLALFAIQLTLGLIFLKTLSLWRPETASSNDPATDKPAASITDAGPGGRKAVYGILFYFFYPGLEVMTGLWAASYLIEILGASPALAGGSLTAFWACLTLGRFAVGLAAGRFSNTAIMRGGLGLAVAALSAALAAAGPFIFIMALAMLGLGLSPLYPTMMHETPRRTGRAKSDQVVSFQVGAALAGAAVLPALTGLASKWLSLAALPWIMLFFAALLIITHEASVVRLDSVQN